MEALKAEVERKRRERAAVAAVEGTEKRKTFASKKQRREEEEKEERRRREETKREEFEEEETKREEERKRSNGTATGSERESEEEKRATRTNKSASKFRSAAARRAFEKDALKETNQNESASKTGSNAREELHKQIEREVKSLTNEEVIVRLRKLNQPAKLFAESEQDRRLRLEVAAKNIKVKESDEHVGGQQGNEMLKYNRESSKEDLTNNNANATTTTNRKLTTKEQEQEKKKREEEMARLEFERAAKRLKKQIDAETDPNAHPIDRVAEHFKRLLKEWAMDIEGTKFETSAQKRQQVANCELTKTHMKPLFKKMKKRDLPNDIERALFLVFEAMKARDYKRATDAYVGVAIGNAAWPIGVTSVGIHDRSARERISATTQAHAMHDEETRKYLQSVKRLITFSQRAYPTNPSLAFDFNSGANGSDKKALENAERATPGFLQNTVSALPRGDGGRKWESLMRHAYDNVKVRSARGSEDGV
jgi:pre-mRNA-splicing factor 18